MYRGKRVALVIPAYNEERLIRPTVEQVPEMIDKVIIVDDASTQFSDEGQALDFRSAVRVTSGGGEIAAGQITVNGPLHFLGYRIHQSEYCSFFSGINLTGNKCRFLSGNKCRFIRKPIATFFSFPVHIFIQANKTNDS